MTALNSPLELGVRALVLLTAAHPRTITLDKLTMMDHYLLHSGERGGPPSVAAPLSTRGGESGVKRTVLEHGLHLMVRAGLVEILPTRYGVSFRASERGAPFIQLIKSGHIDELRTTSAWVVETFGDRTPEEVRTELAHLTSQWADELEPVGSGGPSTSSFIREVSAV